MAVSKYHTKPIPSSRMPSGIPFIIGNEAAERFSFYGMRAILVVFMTKYLMDQYGNSAVMGDEEAKYYYHLFVMSAYFFPIIGAVISDAFLGKYRTIIALSIVYCLGHGALALNDVLYWMKPFVTDTPVENVISHYQARYGLWVGLSLIAIGSGGIKPCVSAHVGDQFGRQNEHLLSRVFGWFYLSINLGSFISILLTPELLHRYGPSVAFGVPGGLMLLATWVFWLGRERFVHVPPAGFAAVKNSLTGDGFKAIVHLIPIYILVAMFWALFDQTGSSWVLQAKQMDRKILGLDLFPSQISAANPIFVLILVPIFSYVVYPTLNRFFEVTPLRKIAIGCFVTAVSFTIPAWVQSRINGGEVVPFKLDATDEHLRSTPEMDDDIWPVQNLIDGNTDETGWAAEWRDAPRNGRPTESANTEKNNSDAAGKTEPESVDIVIQLRERKSWRIYAVRLHTSVKNGSLNEKLREMETKTGGEPSKSISKREKGCQAKNVEILVSDKRVGSWTRVGATDIALGDKTATIEFPPVDAQFVMVRVRSNWGGALVALNEVEVFAEGSIASDAPQELAQVWPNVAEMGLRPSVGWQLFAYLLLTMAEVLISITCLEFSYTQAPNKLKSFIMGLYLLSVSAGNGFAALVNLVIQNPDGSSKLEGPAYFWFFTYVMLAAACLFLFVVKFYRGRTYIQDDDS